MDDATPEEGKPKGIKPAKLTAVIVAVVVVALAGIGGGYAYWTHHEGNAYHEAVAQAENADKALMKAIEQATATEYKADQLKEPKLLDKLDAGNAALAADIASIPEHIRGYGHVKEAHLHKAKARQAELLREWDNPLRIVQAG